MKNGEWKMENIIIKYKITSTTFKTSTISNILIYKYINTQITNILKEKYA
ncbi:hypothetical protein JCM11957_16250 [Caminibacter profundus]